MNWISPTEESRRQKNPDGRRIQTAEESRRQKGGLAEASVRSEIIKIEETF